MKKVITIVIALLVVLVGISFFLIPVNYSISGNDMNISVIFQSCEVELAEKDNLWELGSNIKQYNIKENEAEDIKEQIVLLLKEMKCYRTPHTIMYNLNDKGVDVSETENKMITFIWEQTEEQNVLYIKDKYVMLNGKYYSLGSNGDKKSKEFIENMEQMMETEAEEYCVSSE